MRYALALSILLLSGCGMQTLRIALAPLPGSQPDVFGQVVLAMSRAGVTVTHTDPQAGMIAGTCPGNPGLVGANLFSVLAQVTPAGEASEVVIQATIQQGMDYGETERLLRRIETKLQEIYPSLAFVIRRR